MPSPAAGELLSNGVQVVTNGRLPNLRSTPREAEFTSSRSKEEGVGGHDGHLIPTRQAPRRSESRCLAAARRGGGPWRYKTNPVEHEELELPHLGQLPHPRRSQSEAALLGGYYLELNAGVSHPGGTRRPQW